MHSSINPAKTCPEHTPSKDNKEEYRQYMRSLNRLSDGWSRCGTKGCLYTRR